MSETTRISWTDATWNPWIGCRKVSPGCKNCYAERLVTNRMGRDFSDIRKAQATTFYAPLRWKSQKRVFSCSISDFFIEEADPWRDEAWGVIRRTPKHTYQILTKRPERILQHLPPDWGEGYPNVWLGVSMEMQLYMHRLEMLVKVPAKVHFLSCEPLLGPITFRTKSHWTEGPSCRLLDHIEWVIVGGESGPNFREMHDSWADQIMFQCQEAGVPFFFKQHSGPRSEMGPALEGREYRDMPKAWSEPRTASPSEEHD